MMMTSGQQLRDMGISKVNGNNKAWREEVLAALHIYLFSEKEITGDKFRAHWNSMGGDSPSHQNAWGGIMRSAFLRGWVIDTEKTVRVDDPSGHARRTPVWQSTLFVPRPPFELMAS